MYIGNLYRFRYFSVLAEEITYISNTEQMDLAIRYFNGIPYTYKCITDMFIYFIECEHLSGESIANLIMDKLT